MRHTVAVVTRSSSPVGYKQLKLGQRHLLIWPELSSRSILELMKLFQLSNPALDVIPKTFR